MTTKKRFHVGDVECGAKQLFLISGPCVIEDEALMMQTAEALQKVSESLQLPLIFKSSFQKDLKLFQQTLSNTTGSFFGFFACIRVELISIRRWRTKCSLIF